jgi:Conjugative relaxosome accessory transposon protein
MNSHQMNSCKMAHGLVDGMKNPAAAMADLQTGITNAWSTVKGWASDIADAADQAVTKPSDATTKANAATAPDGRKQVNELGNLTWNALTSRTWNGELLNLADTEVNAKLIVMSLIGTEVRKSGVSADADTTSTPNDNILRLTQLVAPEMDTTGNVGVPIWSCGADLTNCMSPTPSSLATYGIRGFVTANMLGLHDAVAPQVGSIIYQITNCTTPGCSLSAGQLAFLNSIAKVPAVALLMNAQRNPGIVGIITPRLIEEMVNEVSVLYAGAVIEVAAKLYSETSIPKPGSYDKAMSNMLADLRVMQERSAKSVESLNEDMKFIDAANRSLGGALTYRPRK